MSALAHTFHCVAWNNFAVLCHFSEEWQIWNGDFILWVCQVLMRFAVILSRMMRSNNKKRKWIVGCEWHFNVNFSESVIRDSGKKSRTIYLFARIWGSLKEKIYFHCYRAHISLFCLNNAIAWVDSFGWHLKWHLRATIAASHWHNQTFF